MSDPRVFFAAERTLLAWVRSGLTVIALGFVVARFSLFLNLVSGMGDSAAAVQPHWLSNALGTALVLMGAVAILAAMFNHRRYIPLLPPEDVPTMAVPWLTTLFSLGVAITGFILAVYLMIT